MITNKNGIEGQFRQGDIMIMDLGLKLSAVTNIPEGLIKTKICTLAYGEKTGHHHTINVGAKGYSSKDKVSLAEYIEVDKMLALLTHQEHETIEIPKGKYQIIQQKEHTPEEIRNVQD